MIALRAIAFILQIFPSIRFSSSVNIIEPGSTHLLTFEKAYEFTGKPIKNVAYVQHNISAASVECSPDANVIFSKAEGDDCEWREPSGLPISERKMIVDGNTCNLIMMNPTLGQTGVYSCIMMANKGLSRHTFKRQIIVYQVPEYFLTYRMRFLTFSCEEKVLLKLLMELNIIFCPANPLGCKFSIEIEACSSREKEFWMTLNFNENTKSIVTYKMLKYHSPKVRLPFCEMECIRKESIRILMDNDYIDSVLQVKASGEVFRDLTGLILLPDLLEERVDGICKAGYFVYQTKVCLPCPVGYYRSKNMPSCEPCGYFYFQSQIGSTSCQRCPQFGFSSFKDKKSVLECVPFYMTWQGVVAMTSVMMILMCLCMTGYCARFYNKLMEYLRRKTFKDRDERLTEDVVFSPLATDEPIPEIDILPSISESTMISETEKIVSKLPKEFRETLTEEDINFLRQDLENIKYLIQDPKSIGLLKPYKKKILKDRRDDEYLPESIQSRQHPALGWTHKYDTSAFSDNYLYTEAIQDDDDDDEENEDDVD